MPVSGLDEAIAGSLGAYWSRVERLHGDAANKVVRRFIEACARADFQQTLLNRAGSHKPITTRFFTHTTPVMTGDNISSVVGSPPSAQYAAEVLWWADGGFLGYHVTGPDQPLDRLFVDEGDAVARIAFDGRENYLFLGGARGILWLVTPPSKQDMTDDT